MTTAEETRAIAKEAGSYGFPTLIFPGSIPIAYSVVADTAKLSWISPVAIGPIVDRFVGRRA